jgi:hypothetical protein
MISWTAYENRYRTMKPRMRAFMHSIAPLGCGVWEDCSGDYGLVSAVRHAPDDDLMLAVEFYIEDSGDADTGIYGEKGNFHFQVMDNEGYELVSIYPYNYTNRCWAPYENHADWEDKIEIVENCAEYVKEKIDNWLKGKRP